MESRETTMTTMMRPTGDPSAATFPATAQLTRRKAPLSIATDPEVVELETYMQEVRTYSRLSAEREAKLATQIQQGNKQAWQTLVEHNLLFVVSIAHHYRGYGVALADLVEEGNFGLMHAAENYDPTRGRFTTCAYWWINQYIARALHRHGTLIRLPTHVHENELIPLKQARSRLLAEDGTEPDNEMLAELTGIAVERVHEVLRAAAPAMSLEQPYSTSADISIRDVVADEHTAPVDEEVIQSIITDEIHQMLQELLSPRFYTVLQLRYGLDGQPPQTLSAIGKQLGVTYQRIRQIEKLALDILRHSPQLVQLHQALEC